MHAHFAREINMIFRRDVPRQGRPIGESAVVAQAAVVRDVDSDHEEIPRADPRYIVLAGRAMNGHVLADQVVMADNQLRSLAFEFDVLRLASEGGMLKNAVPFAQGGVAFDNGVRADFAAGSDLHTIFHDRIWPDLNIGRNF